MEKLPLQTQGTRAASLISWDLSSGECPVVPMTTGLPQAAAISRSARVASCELKSTTASTERMGPLRSSPMSVAAAMAIPMPGAAAATAWPILPRAPFNRILSGMAVLAQEPGDGCCEDCAVGGRHWAERKPDILARDDPSHRQRSLYGHWARLDEQGPEERVEPAVELRGPGEVVALHKAHHPGYLPREHVRRDADHSFCPRSHEGQRQGVVPAQNNDVVAHGPLQLVHAVDGAARLLNPAHVRMLGSQALDKRNANLHSAA